MSTAKPPLSRRRQTVRHVISSGPRNLSLSLLLGCLLLPALPILKHKPPKRPRILGIAGVTLLVSNVTDARKFYLGLIDSTHTCNYCEAAPARFLLLPSGQRITLQAMPTPAPANLLADVSLLTDDLEGFKRFLKSRKIYFDERQKKHGGELISLLLTDPEGHQLSITDSYHLANSDDLKAGLPPTTTPTTLRIIHAGFIVRNRASTENFYRDILGFRPYWHGGMKDDQRDWVSMQVPDGTDWLEFMVNVEANAGQRLRGIMNHIAIGVPDIRAIQAKLDKIGLTYPEPPQIGRDGKWQLNLYDAELTRTEFMEFKPVQKPCCSDFTGQHPGPQ